MGQASSLSSSSISTSSPSPTALPMAHSQSLDSLSDEILVNICERVRALEQSTQITSRRAHPHLRPPGHDYAPCPTVTALALTSRRFNGPATQVLYENVELDGNNTRQFLYTVVSSPAHAKLVRSIRTKHFSAGTQGLFETYRPRASYTVSPKEVDECIKAFAKQHELESDLHLDGAQKRVIPEGDLDQLLVALAARQLREVDLEICHPGSFRSQDREVLEPHMFTHALLPCSCDNNKFGDRLTSLTLRAPGGINRSVDLHKVVRVLSLNNLRTLTLEGLDSTKGPDTDERDAVSKILKKLKPVSNIRNLHLLECSLRSKDLGAMIKHCSDLKHIAWRCNERSAYEVVDSYRNSCINAKDVIAALASDTGSVKTLTFEHLEEITDWWGINRRQGIFHQHDMGRGTQRSHIGRGNLTKLSSLQTLEITATVFTGLPDGAEDKLDLVNNVPRDLQELRLRMPHDPFPGRMYNLTHGTRHWKMIATMCQELNELTLDLPLRSIVITIPASWPKLSQRAAKKLAEAVTSVHRVHLVLKGTGSWDLDSKIPLPPVPKKPRPKRVKLVEETVQKTEEVDQALDDETLVESYDYSAFSEFSWDEY